MSPLGRWSLHAAAILTGGSGALYGWTRYFGQRIGEFGPEPHPFQGMLQYAHILVAPLLVFALGLLFQSHVLSKLRSQGSSGRRSGGLMGLVMAPMVLSGYGVQVAVDPRARFLLAWVHGLTSLAFLVGLVIHVVRARMKGRIWVSRRPTEFLRTRIFRGHSRRETDPHGRHHSPE